MKKALFIFATFAAAAHAQITNPNKLVAPAPKPPVHRSAPELRSSDLQWIWQYAKPEPQGNKSALMADPRFSALLRDQLTAPQSFWGTKRSLRDAVSDFLAGAGTVATLDNRYVTVTGCVADQCGQKGVLWFDLGASHPLLVFVARRWVEQSKTPDEQHAPYQYWIFANRNLDAAIPVTLQTALNRWANADDCAQTVLVDLDGTPHITSSEQIGIHSTTCTRNG